MKVLDKGSIELLDIMGSDLEIVNAARVSFDGKKKSSDKNLIYYLMEHGHLSPFEMCEMKFRVVLPIFVARQWVRHRTANINEVSARYTELEDNFYTPEKLRGQDKVNKQGSEGELNSEEMLDYYDTECNHLFSIYGAWLEEGVAREQARCILPMSTYTKWIWKCDLRNIFNFLRLRLHPHAQKEIRVYAEAMSELVKECFPDAYGAFETYMLNSVTFTEKELSCLKLDEEKIKCLTEKEQAKLKAKI